MSKTEKIKEQIGYLKVVFSLLIAIDVSIIAWLFKNSEAISNTKTVISLIVAILVAVAIIVINKKILKSIDELEEL